MNTQKSLQTTTRTYLQPGQRVAIRLPWSEVCAHMRVADTVMDVELTADRYPMAQLWKDGREFSFPVTTGEAGIYQEYDGAGTGLFYAYAEPADYGMHDCPCCSDITYDSGNLLCSGCREDGCEASRDAGGDTGYTNCQRADTYAYEGAEL